MRTTTIVTVDGMRTEHCKRAVFTSLSGLSGIERADVEMGRVTIEHDGSVTIEAIRDAIGVAGYTVTHSADQVSRRPLPLMSP